MSINRVITIVENIRKQRNRLSVNRRCGECHKFGHDRRTCPVVLDKEIMRHQAEGSGDSQNINYHIIEHIEQSIRSRYAAVYNHSQPQQKSQIKLNMVECFKEGTYLDNSMCTICLDNTKLDSMIMFKCGHGCCHKCALEILKTTSKCHMCRDNVSEIKICRDIPLSVFNQLNNHIKI